jgi:hypothetical protein
MVCSPSASEERWRRKGSPELERSRRRYSPELGKMTESTSDSHDRPHHGIELDEGNSMVVSICTGSARFRWKSAPEFSRCKSSGRVCGS